MDPATTEAHMKPVVCLALMATIALAGTAYPAQHEPGTLDLPVLAQNLDQLQASGKISAALWTVRNDSCTLQFVVPIPPPPAKGEAAKFTQFEAWLVKADGSRVEPWRQSRLPQPEKLFGRIRETTYEVWYSFPLAARNEAVAAMVEVDGVLYTEKLAPLGKIAAAIADTGSRNLN